MLFHFFGGLAALNFLLATLQWYNQLRLAGSVLSAVKAQTGIQINLVAFLAFTLLALWADYVRREDEWERTHG